MTPAPVDRGPDRGRRTRRPTGDDRERAILATAEGLLETRSLGDVSVDDLARGAGISRPTFYFYFPSKEAVVLALLDRVALEARQRRSEALESVGEDPPELWRRSLAAILETFQAHQAAMLAVAEMLGQSDEIRKLWGEVIEGFVEDTAAAIESEHRRGAAVEGLPARELAIALNWMNERLLYTSIAGLDPAIPAERVLEVVWRIWSRAIYGDDSLGKL